MSMTEKPSVVTIPEAVALVEDGSTVYLGNFGAQLFSVGHELIRQGKRGLHVIVGSGGILLDELLADGIVSEVTLAHCWNPVGPHTAQGWRAKAESGAIVVNELSLGALAAGLQASAWGLPFLPTTDLRNTGYVTEGRANGLLDVAITRFGSAQIVGAITPAIAFVHASAVDGDGNAWFEQGESDLVSASMAADTTVVVAEELTDARAMGRPAQLPGICVSRLVIEPGACHPDGVAGRYPRDTDAYLAYAKAGTAEDRLRWRHRMDSERGGVSRG
jgi:glutaconate CoA-transferase subunit A